MVLEKPDTVVNYEPITFYLRKPDNKGTKITASPYTTIRQLQIDVESKLDIPVLSQELYFNG